MKASDKLLHMQIVIFLIPISFMAYALSKDSSIMFPIAFGYILIYFVIVESYLDKKIDELHRKETEDYITKRMGEIKCQ